VIPVQVQPQGPVEEPSRFGGKRIVSVGVFTAFLLLAVLLGLRSHAFTSELSGESDEAAHYVTSLLVRDYVAQGFPGTPLHYASNYYLHYPKIGIGHWPPLLYTLEAGWMLLFGDSRASGLLLILTMSVGIAFLLYRTIVREFGSYWAGAAAGALYLCIPVIQMYGRMIMADMPVAFFTVLATLIWAEFMTTGSRGAALRFGLCSAAAILTKGNGYALVFVPPVAILITRRWRLLVNRSLWLAVALIGVLTVPWNLYTRKLIVPTLQHPFGPQFFLQGSAYYLENLLLLPGLAITALALIGLTVKVILPMKSGVAPLWASAAALLVGNQLFHSLVPAGFERRYLLGSVAILVLFMAAGIDWLASWVRIGRMRRRDTVAILAALVAAVFFLNVFYIPTKRAYGFDEVARDILNNPAFAHSRILCSSGGDGEGLLIAEIAGREHPRPNHIVVRASQVLARMGWNGQHYRLLVHTPEDVERVLADIPADIVVVDRTPELWFPPHQQLLLETLHRDPRWRLAHIYPNERRPTTVPGARIELYEWTGAARAATGRLHLVYEPTPKVVVSQ
jgi:Dolichyl-phosphate-mannose-protein mannosyltransferase